MKWILLGMAISTGLAGLAYVLHVTKQDDLILPGWDSAERRRMMLTAQANQDDELGFV